MLCLVAVDINELKLYLLCILKFIFSHIFLMLNFNALEFMSLNLYKEAICVQVTFFFFQWGLNTDLKNSLL